MKILIVASLLLAVYLVTPSFVICQNKQDFVKFRTKVGFLNREDSIVDYKISRDDKTLFIAGYNNIQLWDIESGNLISSTPYKVQIFPTFGKLAAFFSFGMSKAFGSGQIENNIDERLFVAAEGEKDNKKLVVREIATGKELTTLEFPVSAKTISFSNNYIVNLGENDKETIIGIWDETTFQRKPLLSVDQYQWHQFFKNEKKILVGSGDTKFSWGNVKHGNKLEIIDVDSGKVERELSAPNLNPKDYYHNTIFSKDERFLLSKRDNRTFIWDIESEQNSPKYIFAPENSKGSLDFVGIIGNKYIVVEDDTKLQIYDIAGDGRPKYELVSNNSKQTYKFIGSSNNTKYFVIKNTEKILFYEMEGNGQPFQEISLLDKEYKSVKVLNEYCIVQKKRKSKKEQHLTYFYNIKTGKVDYEIPQEVGWVKFSPNKKLLYEEYTGSFFAWNVPKNLSLSFSLITYQISCNQPDYNCNENDYFNYESVKLSPNEKFFIKYGKETDLYDTETGEISQSIINAEKAIYDKKRKLLQSGFYNIEFSNNGKYLLATDGRKYYKNTQTISIWDLID